MNIKNRQQLLVILAAVGVGLLVGDRLVLSPLLKGWKQRSAKVAELRKKVAEGKGLVGREDSLRQKWEFMRTNTLPETASSAEQKVLKSIDRWAQDARLTILSISPQWKHDSDDYMTLECRVEASGGMRAVTEFIYGLERDPMALKVQSLEVSARDTEGQQLALGMQLSGLVLTPGYSRR